MVIMMPASYPHPSPSPQGGGEKNIANGGASGNDPRVARAWAIAAAVVDPEIPVVTIADLGILRDVVVEGETIVARVTPTYTGCPAVLAIELAVEAALRDAGFGNVRVERVLSPPWSTDAITEDGRRKLEAYGIAPPSRRGKGALLFADDVVACPRCQSVKTSKVSEFGSTACKALWRCEDCREPFDYFKCH
jgi:ring-1,2-phenylacetyl-CoA epoxidase subunit PaaD